VQVIVYSGAIVVLFLFVIMLLGVDRNADDARHDTLRGQRPAAFALGAAALVELVLLSRIHTIVGKPAVAGAASGPGTNVEKLGKAVFTRYLFAFEVTSVLLVIAVVGAVLLSRKPTPLGEGDR
jgi:NADH-quinone oxidoreductase subunit J